MLNDDPLFSATILMFAFAGAIGIILTITHYRKDTDNILEKVIGWYSGWLCCNCNDDTTKNYITNL